MDKNYTIILIVLVISVLFWIGISIYSVQTKVSVNANASSYTKQISAVFDTAVLDKVKHRIGNNLPISTDVYKSIVLPDSQSN